MIFSALQYFQNMRPETQMSHVLNKYNQQLFHTFIEIFSSILT